MVGQMVVHLDCKFIQTLHKALLPFPFTPQSRLLFHQKALRICVLMQFIWILFVCLFVCLKTLPTSCAGIMEVGVQPFVGHFIDLLQIAGLDIVDKMSQVTLQQTKHIFTRDSS